MSATLPTSGAYRIRPCESRDRGAVYDVCLKTGCAGQDASAIYSDDPEALGNLYVGPYLALEPEYAFALEDSAGVCGYALAALDTARFHERFLSEWLPPLRTRHPRPSGPPETWTPSQRIHESYHAPSLSYPPELKPYPSHLHIDLLPRAQGQGLGGRMIWTVLEKLRSHGSPGVFVEMAASNARAERFYLKHGFKPLLKNRVLGVDSLYLGLKF